MDKNIIADEKHETAQHEQQQKPSSSYSSGLSAFPKRTRVCDADDDETAPTPPPAHKKVKLNDPEGRSGAEAEAGGRLEDDVWAGEAPTIFASEQGNTAARVDVLPGQAHASQQQAVTPSASTIPDWQKQAGAWLSRGAAAADKKSIAPAGTQHKPATAQPRGSESYFFPSVYASGSWWHLIVPTDHPPPFAGDDQVYQLVRIPAPWGGRSPFKHSPTSVEPPLAQPDLASQPLDIVDDLIHYIFSRPILSSPFGEQRFKVNVRREWTDEGRQMYTQQERAQPHSGVITFRPPQPPLLQVSAASPAQQLRAVASTSALQGSVRPNTWPAAPGGSTPSLLPGGAFIEELPNSSPGTPASPPRSVGSAAQHLPAGSSTPANPATSTGPSALAPPRAAVKGTEHVTGGQQAVPSSSSGQQAATSTGAHQTGEAAASTPSSPLSTSAVLPPCSRSVSPAEPRTDAEIEAMRRERSKRTGGPEWAPTPTPEPESPKDEHITSGQKTEHGQESENGSHEGDGKIASRNREDADKDDDEAG